MIITLLDTTQPIRQQFEEFVKILNKIARLSCRQDVVTIDCQFTNIYQDL